MPRAGATRPRPEPRGPEPGARRASPAVAQGSRRQRRRATPWWWVLPALLAFTMAVKVVVLVQLNDHRLLQPADGLDGQHYVELARQLQQGSGPPGAFAISPLYACFLALVFSAGGSLLAAKVVQISLGTFAVGLLYATARRWFGQKAAWMAAAVAAFTGLFTFYEVIILQAALDPFLTALLLYVVTRAVHSGDGRWYAAAGAAIALQALNRPNVLPYLAVLAAAPLVRAAWARTRAQADRDARSGAPGSARAGLTRAGLAVAAAVLVLAPVAIRNSVAAGELVLISSHGGLNFYIGNNAEADGTYRSVAGITPSIVGQERDARRVAEEATGRPLGPGEVSAFFYGRAWSWIASHPGEALRLFGWKLLLAVNHAELSLNYSYAYYRWDEPTSLRWLLVGAPVLVPLGLVGMFIPLLSRSARGRPGAARGLPSGYWVWAAFVPVYALGVAAFFVSSRYRLPLLVALVVPAGASLAFLATVVRERRLREAAPIAGLIALLAVMTTWNLGVDEGRAEERRAAVVALIDQGEIGLAQAQLARFEHEDPDPAMLGYRAGQAFAEREAYGEAVMHLRRAATHDPDRPEIQFSLGQALLAAGRVDEAIGPLEAARRAGLARPGATYALAAALASRGDRHRALEQLRQMTDSAKEPETGLLAGELALELGEPALAVSLLPEPARSGQRRGVVHEKRGLALTLLGRTREAVTELEAASRLQPERPSVWLNLAVAYAEDGRFAEARRTAGEALRLDPDYDRARRFLDTLSRR